MPADHNRGRSTPEAGAIKALCIFVALHVMLSVDRSIMVVALEPLRNEFKLSDTQLGLLTGIGFAFFFGLAGLPLGYMVDRWNRRNILAASTGLFSLMTLLASFVTSFPQLLATRLLVGAGEAGGTPSMLSMLSDLFPPEQRARAMSIYYSGVPLGGIVVLFAGAWIAQTFGWRTLFLVAGVPGLVLALLLLVFVREPARKQQVGVRDKTDIRATLRFMWSQRAVRHLIFMTIVGSAASLGLFFFTVSFLVRAHNYSLAEAGFLMGASYGVVGLFATVLSGAIVDRLARRDERWRPWFCSIVSLVSCASIIGMALATGPIGITIGVCMWAFSSMATYGPTLALLQSLVGARMRGTASAAYLFMSYFVGASLGPQFVGSLSDVLTPHYGANGLAIAIMCAALLYCWGAAHYFLAARTVRADLVRATGA
ncbi:MFS transporter (plasmid) [Sphingobium sp. JS3065]|uniref:spinster family MFS transporter n=1 Tax=Sphingobium sp. JS3065 TaxID=2970925 RepID=UPI002264130A|nr:MFS transporter [Sphingobium sp. JS3065]UZW58276.1 MFS transporter [Sphingobium sp. JS3065]